LRQNKKEKFRKTGQEVGTGWADGEKLPGGTGVNPGARWVGKIATCQKNQTTGIKQGLGERPQKKGRRCPWGLKRKHAVWSKPMRRTGNKGEPVEVAKPTLKIKIDHSSSTNRLKGSRLAGVNSRYPKWGPT